MTREFTPSHRGGAGEPLLLLHGFTDSWRTWELVLPRLEERFEVLAPTLPGHAGGSPLPDEIDDETLTDGVEAAMEAAGWQTAHVVGNSLGGYVGLQLAARSRARSVVALAPAGGWAEGDESFRDTLAFFSTMHAQVRAIAANADAIAASPEGRRAATQFVTERYEHIPPDLVAHQIIAAAACDAEALIAYAEAVGYDLDAERIDCPVRVVWGTEDRVLAWPRTAARFRQDWLPAADWVELDGVGHCPQLDVPLECAELIAGFAGSPA